MVSLLEQHTLNKKGQAFQPQVSSLCLLLTGNLSRASWPGSVQGYLGSDAAAGSPGAREAI